MSGPYLIYGRRPVQEYIRSEPDPGAIEAVYLAESFPGKFKSEILGRLRGVSLREFPRRKLDQMFEGINHQGVVLKFAKGRQPGSSRRRDYRELFQAKEGLIVVLDRIQDPQNLGSIIRTSESLGARALIITGKGAALTPAADRASAGASFHLEIHAVAGLDGVMETARKAGYWICVSALPDEEEGSRAQAVPLFTDNLRELPPSEEILLVIGTEGEGVRPLTLKKADYILTIPLHGKTASLNAGVATGILLDRLLNRTDQETGQEQTRDKTGRRDETKERGRTDADEEEEGYPEAMEIFYDESDELDEDDEEGS